MNWFPPEFRTASVVPRWSIIWTLTRDTLSNHSFFVSLYTNQIAKMIGWGGNFEMLLFKALTHDLDECSTGDIVAPAKQAILDTERAKHYVQEQMQKRMPTIVEQMNAWQVADASMWAETGKIVKAADRLDALLFLTVEQRMGNGVVGPRIPEVRAGLKSSWFLLPAPPERLVLRWRELEAEIAEHSQTGGYGV